MELFLLQPFSVCSDNGVEEIPRPTVENGIIDLEELVKGVEILEENSKNNGVIVEVKRLIL